MNYYISDTHFGHANIIGFDKRPFQNTLEMEEKIIENWNKRATKDDVVYILGDFCWGTEKEWLRILDLLNGEKVLIKGNHDIKSPSAQLKKKFRQICDYKEITDCRKRIIMSHYPNLFYRASYGDNTWHFCGHTHNRTNEESKRRKYVWDLVTSCREDSDNRGHIINVGCMMDYMDYTPRTADELISWWKQYYVVDDQTFG
jgi:calcineurin-like phosphoesterase family protein